MNENENIILTIREINIPINNNSNNVLTTHTLIKTEILSVPPLQQPIEIQTLFQPRIIIRRPMKMTMTNNK